LAVNSIERKKHKRAWHRIWYGSFTRTTGCKGASEKSFSLLGPYRVNIYGRQGSDSDEISDVICFSCIYRVCFPGLSNQGLGKIVWPGRAQTAVADGGRSRTGPAEQGFFLPGRQADIGFPLRRLPRLLRCALPVETRLHRRNRPGRQQK
jgi:hypothetical protein